MSRGQEVAGGFVVPGCDCPELFEFGEDVLDEVARLIKVFVELPLQAPVGFGRDDHAHAGLLDGFDDTFVRVIGFIRDKLVRFELSDARQSG